MQLADLLRETLDTATLECWQRERTATPVRAFAVRLHATGCSLKETEAVFRLLDVEALGKIGRELERYNDRQERTDGDI